MSFSLNVGILHIQYSFIIDTYYNINISITFLQLVKLLFSRNVFCSVDYQDKERTNNKEQI